MPENKDNHGVLFKNHRKESGDKKPDYNGSALIAGVDHFISAWVNTSQKGTKYMSLAFTRKDDLKKEQPKPESQPDSRQESTKDDLPF